MKCPWYSKIEEAYELCHQYLSMFNGVAPMVTKYHRRAKHNPHTSPSRSSIWRHTNNIIDIIRYKSNGDNQVYLNLRNSIGNKWKGDMIREWKLMECMSVTQSQSLQSTFKLTDKPFLGLCAAINKYLGWRLFPGANKQKYWRKNKESQSQSIRTIELKRESTNQYETRLNKMFDIWSCHETEIIPLLFEKQINNNKFVFLEFLDGECWIQYGADKGTTTGYAESLTIIGPTLSAAQSLPCLYIPDTDLSENGPNLMKSYQHLDYNKMALWKSLSKKPCLVGFVLYHLDLNNCIESRLVRMCVVNINPTKQSLVNSLDDVIEQDQLMVQNLKFDKDQFDTEWTLQKSKTRIKSSCWSKALDELKTWECKYDRPNDIGCMSETERQGFFDSQSML